MRGTPLVRWQTGTTAIDDEQVTPSQQRLAPGPHIVLPCVAP